ncbi:anaerobic dehydrogenase, typically selenocysteine-containing [Candidatus Methanoperedens nitroreducens]|uniref:Anaerobic dehydrogenase, typically selenocysteine-containing n=1 Tax=Candidatus Methanoperedens nitratireducens TaxID=1392998 RepID=A0A062VCA8_9EURY|nr:molybdopterin-dependent oxidoreductase [Candidatus Methanoperedens nitroreducens]KCZ73329.1 anaerobic dehydrogenase, typically selenocysteine-containing [Candidatus Methanoperedens nitroreducens]MDJ1422723.1 molybdopterin-dependent oxidoreductase [Candidatus Methanoperedens sp.]
MVSELKINRRSFLKVAGAVGAATMGYASLGQPVIKALAQGVDAAREEKWISSVCIQCPAGCGTKVRVVNGKAVKIEGNPEHPYSNGKLCPKGYAGLQLLYDVDRVKSPLKRTNPNKGQNEDPKFVPVTWDEALDDIADRLKKIRDEGKSHTVAYLSGRNRGRAGTVWGTFTKLYGTPNNLGHSSICADASKKARLCLDGTDDYCAYDWENCNYVLNFGGATLEAWRPTNLMLQKWAHMRRGRPVRAKQVIADTRFSTTAIKADEWLPVKPGTDGGLALGIAHVILTEGLWDRSFVGDFKEIGRKFITGETVANEDFEEVWTSGLVDWWNNVLINFTPSRASQITGIPAGTIIRIAREFATTKPAIAGGERGAGAHTNGAYNHMSIHALNALVGSMFALGGVMYQIGVPYGKLPIDDTEYMDDIAKKVEKDFKEHTLDRIDKAKSDEWPIASNVYQNIPDNHANGNPYKLSVLFTYYTNPLFSNPNPQRAHEAFKDVFIVETSSYLSETALYADYILPDAYYLERWQDDTVYASTGYPVTGLRVPAVQPVYDNRNSMEVIIDLGKRMDGKMGEYYNALGSFENMLHSIAKGFETAPGDNGVNSFDLWAEKGAWYKKPYLYRYSNGKFYEWDGVGYNKELKKTEETVKETKDGKEVETKAIKDPVKDKLLKTKSGKFEFRSSKLGGFTDNQKEVIKKKLKIPDLFEYPHYEEPTFAGKAEGFPLHMSSPKMITHAEGRGANAQWLQERFGVIVGEGWTNWVELNPDKADELGIKNGDVVWVESPVGKVKTIAVINPGNPPWIVVFPFEHGHWNYGRYAKGLGANPNEILANLSDPISAQSCTNATMVRVYRA